ncbi:MAG: carbamate kinase [Malacoplasma sp.]|nr:carbamate kinase [Malacoplasma sp.]
MKIVIALGGNALGNNPIEQKELVKIPSNKIVNLVKQNHTVVIGHGNGPQVGMIYNAFKDAKKVNDKTALIPFAEAGGMSQGYIGYHLLTAVQNELNLNQINKNVVYFQTLTYVDPNDTAFLNPTKPVGIFYKTIEEAKAFNPDSTIVEDSGRGFRVVVPSPVPIDFLGIDAIKSTIENGAITIVGGGGGIPIVKKDSQLFGVDGVIDKDFTCALIAQKINADMLVILTAIDGVYINFNTPAQQKLTKVSASQLSQYIGQNQFAKGSMLPKIEAAIKFVRGGNNKKAIIADLKDLEKAIEEKAGTTIVA